jgi:hypothetical protein
MNFEQRDRIDLGQLFDRPKFSSNTPFTSYIQVKQTSSGTNILLDTNGDRTSLRLRTLVTVEGVNSTSINANSFIF